MCARTLRYRERGMGIASRAARRFCIALAGATFLVAAASVASCTGDNGDTGSSGTDYQRPSSTAGWPPTRNRSFRVLIGNMVQGPVLAPSVSVLTPGEDRFGFALFDRGNRQIGDLDVALYLSKGLDETARGPYLARYERNDVRPQFRSRTTAEDPDSAQSVYVARLPFPSAGTYLVSAVAKLDRRLVATSPAQVTVRETTSVPSVGDRAIPVHTPTVASAHGDLKSIDTRVPPDDMHDVDLVDALKRKRPVVLLFATPALCQSRVCGPVVDVAEEVKSEFEGKLDFIHMEIYRDNDLSKGPRPQVPAWGLCSHDGESITCTEPWLFTIDKHGRVAARLQGAFNASELETAVRRALR
jgi:hypothetical protein